MMATTSLTDFLELANWPVAEVAAWAFLLTAAAVLIDRGWRDVVQSAWRRGLDQQRRLSYSQPLLRLVLFVTVPAGTLYALWAQNPVAAFAVAGSITGLAVLLATDHLRDIVGGLALALTRPFHVGDTIKSERLQGRVEQIFLTECVLRGAGGEKIRAPNRHLARSALLVAYGGEALPEDVEVPLPPGLSGDRVIQDLRDLAYLSAYIDGAAPVVVERMGDDRARIRATPIAPDDAAALASDLISRAQSLSAS